jgi:hypothetical protein
MAAVLTRGAVGGALSLFFLQDRIARDITEKVVKSDLEIFINPNVPFELFKWPIGRKCEFDLRKNVIAFNFKFLARIESGFQH